MFTASHIVNQIAVLFFAALMIWAAFTDFRHYIIPNKICLAVVGVYPAFVLTSAAPVDWVAGVAAAGALLALGFVCFVFNWIGAGDAKLLAAAALWAGADLIAPFLMIVALAGGAISVAAIVRARHASVGAVEGGSAAIRVMALLKTRVAYGAAIAVGGLYLALQRLAF